MVGQLWDGTTIQISLTDLFVLINATGTSPSLAEIGEQFAWLGAACRVSPHNDKMAYSTAHIKIVKNPITLFKIDFSISNLEVDSRSKQNGSYWHSLFRNAVIVRGYPILARAHDESGLEIALNMMAGSGQASCATIFDGALVIKGFSTMFVPMGRIRNSVLWHFLYNKDTSRISYLSARERCSRQALIDTVDVSCLEYTRNFLGWASSVLMQSS